MRILTAALIISMFMNFDSLAQEKLSSEIESEILEKYPNAADLLKKGYVFGIYSALNHFVPSEKSEDQLTAEKIVTDRIALIKNIVNETQNKKIKTCEKFLIKMASDESFYFETSKG